MRVEDLTIEVRNADLERVGQLRPADLVGFTAVLKFNAVGTWKVNLPVGHPMAEQLKLPGSGLIVSTDQGVIFSGCTTSVVTNQTLQDPAGVYEISGVDDSILLVERLAYPTPTTADVTAQVNVSDDRTGAAEDVMKAYVEANIGAQAPAARKVSSLAIEPSAGLGATVTASARFQTLQELLVGLADVSGLGFTIEQAGSVLQFQVYQPLDRSATVRLDLYNGRLTRSEFTYSRPNATHVIVGGAGDGSERILLERTSLESQEAAALWNRRIEVFADSRGASDSASLQQAADEILATDGRTITSSSVTPSDDQTMRFGIDWNLGDRVSVVVNDEETSAVVTEVGILITAEGVRIGATIGDTSKPEVEAQLAHNLQSQDERISNLERNDSQLVATQLKQLVNNRTGSTLLKGQVVYINGAQGNRVTVALAQANGEITSSKTFGIVEADIADNQSGYIITQGTITGVNTSALAEGAAAWLSPSVPGGFTATKPTAPNHLVLVGFVERSHAVNGSLFVKTQNGFEIEELHNVLITSPTDGQFLKYQASTGLWVNSN